MGSATINELRQHSSRPQATASKEGLAADCLLRCFSYQHGRKNCHGTQIQFVECLEFVCAFEVIMGWEGRGARYQPVDLDRPIQHILEVAV